MELKRAFYIAILSITLIGMLIPLGFWADNQILLTTYSKIPESYRTKPIIEGSFIQYTGLQSWTYEMWDNEFAHLGDLGIDTIILQWSHDASTNKTLYPSSIFQLDNSSVSEAMIIPPNESDDYSHNSGGMPDVIGVFLHLGKKYNISIYIGLSIDWEFAEKIENATLVTRIIELNRILVRELLELYGKSPAFAGFYIPYEMYQGPKSDGEDGMWLASFFGALVRAIRDEINETSPQYNGLISIAPYAKVPEQIRNVLSFWNTFLKNTPIDVLMIQDGVGSDRNDIDELPLLYSVIAEKCWRYNISFWADVEIFRIQNWTPAPIDEVIEQLQVAAKYTDRIVVFDIPHYMSPQYSNRSAELFDAYNQYVQSLN